MAKPKKRFTLVVKDNDTGNTITLHSHHMEFTQEAGARLSKPTSCGQNVTGNGQSRAQIRLWDGCLSYDKFIAKEVVEQPNLS